jgi:hypothetical protein
MAFDLAAKPRLHANSMGLPPRNERGQPVRVPAILGTSAVITGA